MIHEVNKILNMQGQKLGDKVLHIEYFRFGYYGKIINTGQQPVPAYSIFRSNNILVIPINIY